MTAATAIMPTTAMTPMTAGAPVKTHVRGRYAPSPTGPLHLGNARTALLAWLQVRSQGGAFVLRMEDLDHQRSSPQAATALLEDLRWLGLDWDEGPDVGGPYTPYVQSQRQALYEEALAQLREQNRLYRCYCTRAELAWAANAPHPDEEGPPYRGTCRSLTAADSARHEAAGRRGSWRYHVDPGPVCYKDDLAGPVCQDVAEAVGDFVVQRSDGVVAYQLAVVADDALMHITHVLRGADLISSTPRQIMLYRALGFLPPRFAHVPLLYGADGARLSKRHGSVSVASLRGSGIAAEVVTGYLSWLSGLVPKGTAARPSDLVSRFSMETVSRRPSVVDPSRLVPELQAW